MSSSDQEGAVDSDETSTGTSESQPRDCGRKVQFNEDIEVAYFESAVEESALSELDGQNLIRLREDGTYSLKEILQLYSKQCNDSGFNAKNDEIYQQLQGIKRTYDHSAVLNINTLILTTERVMCLKIVLRLITFKTLYINTTQLLNNDFVAILALHNSIKEFVVIELYHRPISWGHFAGIIKECRTVTSITFRDICVGKEMCVKLQDSIDSHVTLTVLKFEGCQVLSSLNYILSYTGINEIHISNCNLSFQHCEFIAYHLMFNSALLILDLSHNEIDDGGLELMATAIFEKRHRPHGISELVLLHNKLTKECYGAINLLLLCKRLRVLNLGFNNLGDDFLSLIKENLSLNCSIEGLGLQNTGLGYHAMVDLQEICISNGTLLHLNIKENKSIKPLDLEEFARSIHKTSLIHCEFDTHAEASFDGCYATSKMKRILSLKRKIWNLVNNRSWFPERSLICFSDYASPVKLKSRFEVTRIQETGGVATTSKDSRSVPGVPFVLSSTFDSVTDSETDSLG